MPVSATSILTWPVPCAPQPTRTSPCSVYFSALSTRFTSICSMRNASALMGGSSSEHDAESFNPCVSARCANMPVTSEMRRFRSRGSGEGSAPRASRPREQEQVLHDGGHALGVALDGLHPARRLPVDSPSSISRDPMMEVRGVRSSWDALTTKSRFTVSSRRISVVSLSTTMSSSRPAMRSTVQSTDFSPTASSSDWRAPVARARWTSSVSRGARTTSQSVFPSTGLFCAARSSNPLLLRTILPVAVQEEDALLNGGEDAVQLLHALRALEEQRLHPLPHGVEAVGELLDLVAAAQVQAGAEIARSEPSHHPGEVAQRRDDGAGEQERREEADDEQEGGEEGEAAALAERGRIQLFGVGGGAHDARDGAIGAEPTGTAT